MPNPPKKPRKQPTLEQMLARITSENDRDRAECDDWMRTAPLGMKLEVWALIQREYDDPIMECMSRFAQLAYAESATRVEQEETSANDS